MMQTEMIMAGLCFMFLNAGVFISVFTMTQLLRQFIDFMIIHLRLINLISGEIDLPGKSILVFKSTLMVLSLVLLCFWTAGTHLGTAPLLVTRGGQDLLE